jgi:carbon monoxide dehydrogenase subunit G
VRIEGSEKVAVPRSAVWSGLNDPAVLRACTPGLTRLDESSKDHFDAVLELAIPALTGRFEGSVDIVERAEKERMKLRLKGQGSPGFVNGTAELHLADADGGGTQLGYVVDVQVGGQIARLGQRMIFGVTKEMLGQFFEALERRLAAPAAAPRPDASHAPAAAAAPPALGSLFQLAWRTLLNLLGLSKRS